MTTLHVIILSLIQGFTEFLPISSSAHLILPSQLLGWPDQGPVFDVTVHVGTLLAVLLYFRRDVSQLFCAWWRAIVAKEHSAQSRMAWLIILATIPAVVFGGLFSGLIETYARSVSVIAFTTLVFGLLLGWVDLQAPERYDESHMGVKHALYIGFAQALAMIPGTSRSGITMTAARQLGYSRGAAARFSFLLSIPVILGAATLLGAEVAGSPINVPWHQLGLGLALSFASALACIHLFLKWVTRVGMLPFVIYRLFLGVALIWLAI
ncbi:undecaprenyl-diphosphate phosphatase [Celerinatantimonas yamalensis]|uniref:Undecaprenyl-diphosphatase n=1 Tax=Celerinatantimonas yamalensis TaxID=559956 RepID=A0ABW9G507_9GAMM